MKYLIMISILIFNINIYSQRKFMQQNSSGADFIIKTEQNPDNTIINNEINNNLKDNLKESFINPLRPQDWRGLSSKFGIRVHPVLKTIKHHSGIDIPAPLGTPVYATKSGVILLTNSDNINGKYLKIDHSNGYITAYAHLSKILVKVGHLVKRGEIIALVGATGRVTGSHLHYEVSYNGKKENPEKYLLFKN